VDETSREGEDPETKAGASADETLSVADNDNSFTQEVEFFEADDELYGEDEEEDAGRTETVDEQGRRHVRLAAPEGTDEILEQEIPRRTGLPDWAERWRVRSATGTVLTAVAFGLQQVFETERKEPAIVMETSGEPPTDLPVEADLQQLGPRQSSVTVRPWLLGNGSEEAEVDEEAGGPEDGGHQSPGASEEDGAK
jgi:hypothetical protein